MAELDERSENVSRSAETHMPYVPPSSAGPDPSSRTAMQQPISIRPSVENRSASSRDLLEPLLLGLLVLAIAAAWTFYVFRSSQLAYLCAVAASTLLGVRLAAIRSQATVILLIAEVALLGTEANGALARGTAPLGTFRILDITIAAALLTLGVTGMRRRTVRVGNKRGESRRTSAKASYQIPSLGLLFVVGVVGWALIMWFLHGDPVDGITKTDIRVFGLCLAMWLIVRACVSGPPRDLSSAFAGLAPAITTKAVAIFASGIWVVGTYDRLQASLSEVYGLQTRVILIGGDTVLILIPAATAIALGYVKTPVGRLALWFCALASLVGLLISGTRTGLLVAAATVGLALFLREPRVRLRRPSVRAASTAVAILALTTAGLVVTGTGARFTKRDAPHVGLNFRTDEVRSFFRLPTSDLLFGQGFGGRFESKDVNGLPVITGWSHVLPVWIWLKVGLIGSVAVLTATILVLRKAFHALRPKPRLHDPDAALALVVMAGLLLMSLTINRVALPEGAVLFGCALGLLDRNEKDLPS